MRANLQSAALGSFRSHLTRLVVALVFPILLFSAVAIWLLTRDVASRIEDHARQLTAAVSADVSAYVQDTVETLSVLAAAPSMQNGDFEGFAGLVGTLAHETRGKILVTDQDGLSLIDTAEPFGSPLGSRSRPDLSRQTIEKGEPVISESHVVTISQPPVVTVNIPVHDRTGRPYVLAEVLPPEAILATVARSHLPVGWIVGVVDADGKFIMRSLDQERFLGKPARPEVIEAIKSGAVAGQFANTTHEGTLFTSFFQRIPGTDWTVLVGVPNALLQAPLIKSLAALSVFGCLTLLVTVAGARKVAQKITTGACLLEGAAHAPGKGESPQPVGHLEEFDRIPKRMAVDAEEVASSHRKLDEANHRYRELLAHLNGLLEHAPVGFAYFDREHRYVRMNQRLADINGLPIAAHLGRSIADVLPTNARVVIPLIDRVFATGETIDGLEVAGETPLQPGIERHWLTGWFPVGTDGKISLVGAVVNEITHQKRIEAALAEAKEEAEKGNLAKSKFLAAASHDLRQPIQSMILFAHALSARLQGHPALQIVEKMMEAQDTFKSLLDSLLDLSKLDAGLVIPDLQPMPAAQLVEELADAYRLRAAEKGMRFKVRSSDAWLIADRTLLARILSNFLDNAIKYTMHGGILLSCRRAGDMARFDVVDTGVGIEAQHLDDIFGEFVQVGDAGRDQKQGMGLGLATVARLCNLLSYNLRVWSHAGRGTGFSIWVPICEPASQAASPQTGHVTDRPKRLLVIDDEAAILEGVKILTEGWGYQTIVAMSLDQALEQLDKSVPPDAIVADFRLGAGVTGPQVIAAIRGHVGTRVPALLVTGDTGLPEQHDFVVLHKPFAPDLLRKRLAEICDERPKPGREAGRMPQWGRPACRATLANPFS